jgi:hypothetical protein
MKTYMILVLAGLCFSEVQAVQQTFWPLNQWPPSGWKFAPTNDSPVVFNSGNWYIKDLQLFNFSNSIAPPALGASMTVTNSSAQFQCSFSSDGIVYFPAAGVVNPSSKPFILQIVHTNNIGAISVFSNSVVQLNMRGTWAGGTLFIRKSVSSPTTGQTIYTTTSGGFMISSFIDLQLQISSDGINFFSGNAPTHLELSGTPGVPATLSISNAPVGNVVVSWTTQTNAHYQLLWNNSLATANWNTLGSVMQGTVSNLSASDSTLGQTQRFYKVQLSP